jgi:hypothetical protein
MAITASLYTSPSAHSVTTTHIPGKHLMAHPLSRESRPFVQPKNVQRNEVLRKSIGGAAGDWLAIFSPNDRWSGYEYQSPGTTPHHVVIGT